MRNIGSLMHNFDLIGSLDGPFLVPGQTSTITVTLKPGTYTYVCSVKYHAAEGMQGTFTVTASTASETPGSPRARRAGT